MEPVVFRQNIFSQGIRLHTRPCPSVSGNYVINNTNRGMVGRSNSVLNSDNSGKRCNSSNDNSSNDNSSNITVVTVVTGVTVVRVVTVVTVVTVVILVRVGQTKPLPA